MLPHFIESNEAMVLDYYRQKLKNIQKHWIIQVLSPHSSTLFRIRIIKIISMGWISSSSSVQLGIGNDLKSTEIISYNGLKEGKDFPLVIGFWTLLCFIAYTLSVQQSSREKVQPSLKLSKHGCVRSIWQLKYINDIKIS